MLARGFAALFLFLVLLLVPACDEFAEDKEEIKTVFDNVNLYNNTKNGKAILECFTEESFAAYEPTIRVALDGTKEEVLALGPTERLEALMIRLMAKRKEVEKLSGREYCEFATSRGWYVTPPLEQTSDTLKKITVRGNNASGQLYSDGQKTGLTMRFVKQGGNWRFDEPDAMAQWDQTWQQAASIEGASVTELILEELEARTGKEITDAIWKPMKK